MNKPLVVLYLTAMLSIQGCATKTYGRLDGVETSEMTTLTCTEIDAQMTRAQAFVDDVNRKSAFSSADVLAFLIDFGIGNAIEKTSALKSADERMSRLRKIRKAQHCSEA